MENSSTLILLISMMAMLAFAASIDRVNRNYNYTLPTEEHCPSEATLLPLQEILSDPNLELSVRRDLEHQRSRILQCLDLNLY